MPIDAHLAIAALIRAEAARTVAPALPERAPKTATTADEPVPEPAASPPHTAHRPGLLRRIWPLAFQ